MGVDFLRRVCRRRQPRIVQTFGHRQIVHRRFACRLREGLQPSPPQTGLAQTVGGWRHSRSAVILRQRELSLAPRMMTALM